MISPNASSRAPRRIRRRRDHLLQVEWRYIGIGASLVALAVLVAAGIALAVADVDALTTTALVLAVVAFVFQLIMFIASSWTSSQQMLQSQELNADTGRLLGEMRSTLEEMSAVAGERFDRLLDRALGEAREAAEEDVAAAPPTATAETALARYEAALREYAAGLRHGVVSKPFEPSQEDREIIRLLQTYPSDEAVGRAALRGLAELSSADLIILSRLAHQEVTGRRSGRPIGAWLFADRSSYDELLNRGLIEHTSAPDDVRLPADFGQRPYVSCRLTAAGRALGRFFAARGTTPNYLWDDASQRGQT